ncbi:MAG: hypothetical protein ABFD92_07875 [Planctomycetaceae bacterium]|nr:hypothetical protein [Planctomycetaceae bacterium]
MTDTSDRIQAILDKIPPEQKQLAADLLAQYGSKLLSMAREDAWAYLRRLGAGDLQAAAELDAQLSDAEFIARIKTNTARWESVERYNQVREDMKTDFLLRLAPAMASMLAAMVGL